jgi:hypothetical protein
VSFFLIGWIFEDLKIDAALWFILWCAITIICDSFLWLLSLQAK